MDGKMYFPNTVGELRKALREYISPKEINRCVCILRSSRKINDPYIMKRHIVRGLQAILFSYLKKHGTSKTSQTSENKNGKIEIGK